MSNIIDQLNEVKKRFSDDIFLSNKGLSNEVGIQYSVMTQEKRCLFPVSFLISSNLKIKRFI